MKLNFRNLAILTSFIFFALALIWMFAPNLLLSNWGVELSSSVELVGRRGAALYAGISVMFFSARNAEASPARSALVAGFVAACLTLAALGFFDLMAGHASHGILAAVFIEVTLALAFLYVGRARRNAVTFNKKPGIKR
ncbi:hypothetical protein [Novimethylophilus kurashikiensis]|uniref:hypothetical protein n=1 Tax=Novimethylophilus kurashikiensis TaxID=1825523 RepID=UPI000D5939D0|nr:hypothetical protein [Novimethylophilus kurashikiensis]